jgi:hypothetical protein
MQQFFSTAITKPSHAPINGVFIYTQMIECAIMRQKARRDAVSPSADTEVITGIHDASDDPVEIGKHQDSAE